MAQKIQKCRLYYRLQHKATPPHGQKWIEIQTNLRAIQKNWPRICVDNIGWQPQKYTDPTAHGHPHRLVSFAASGDEDYKLQVFIHVHLLLSTFALRSQPASAVWPHSNDGPNSFHVQRWMCRGDWKWSIGSSKWLFLCYPAAVKISQP